MTSLLAALRRLLPGTVMALLFVVLAGTGFFLHWTPRFQSLSWGLTELVHVWVGWAALIVTGGYLVHHLARTWGPLTTLQRILGVALTSLVAVAMLTGVLVVWPPRGGPPSWAVPVHFGSTFGVLGLFVWHSAVGWTRWAKRRWRLIVHGPAPAEAAAPSVPATTEEDEGDPPGDPGESGAEEPQDEGERPVDEP